MERARPVRHGTKYRYDVGCRCPYCKMASSIHHKKKYFKNGPGVQRLKEKTIERRADRKKRGVCIDCGFELDDFRDGKSLCSSCSIMHTERNRNRRELIRHAR